LDVNDNPPEFTSKYYFATVAEGVPVGTDVVRLLATSRDFGVNAEITYAIVGGNEHRIFTIDPHSGLVSVAASIDYERSRAFFLTVQARDGGEPPLTNRATVNITVLDVNDNAPVFGQMSYSAAVSESSEVGVGILSLTATDLDQGENGRIHSCTPLTRLPATCSMSLCLTACMPPAPRLASTSALPTDTVRNFPSLFLR